MFGFRVHYLTGAVVASDVTTGNEKSRVEWPPHPDRLFCALVQAWGDLSEPEDGRAALKWLERRGAPRVRATQLHDARKCLKRYVPANDDKAILGRTRSERRIPTASVGDSPVEVFWPGHDAGEHLDNLRRLAAAVASLGHPSSLVQVSVATDFQEHGDYGTDGTWIDLTPNDEGLIPLRVPHGGRFDHLVERYHAVPRRRPAPSKWVAYSEAKPTVRALSGLFGDLVVFRLRGNGRLPIVSTAQVLRAMRGAVMAHSDQPPAEVISGHAAGSTPEGPKPSQRPHLALVPLPDVGHTHAGGHLLGIAAVLPRDLAPDERRACLIALGRAAKHPLTIGQLGSWDLERQSAFTERYGLLPSTWSVANRHWATVTPFVFGKYPDTPYGDEAVALVCESCRLSGLPEPAGVEVGPVSPVTGVPRASEFPPLASRPGKPRKCHVHLRLTFAEPVAGPLLVGWGRYQGYGLCRPLQER